MKLDINTTLDLDPFLTKIKYAKNLEDKEFFGELAKIQSVKDELKDIQEAVEDVERQVKQAINDRAKALYGDNWQAIKGEGFKISRSMTGAVYSVTDKADDKFIQLSVRPDTKAIDSYIETKGELPGGVDFNPKRNESLRITVAKNDS